MSLSFHNEGREIALNNSKSLISTDAFNTALYSYSTKINTAFNTIGTLALLTGLTTTNCPAGRVLHLTGKRLIPGVNPMSVFPSGSTLSSQTSPGIYMISVYDPVSGFRGFIDPTSVLFANFDQALPNFYDLGNSGATLPLLGGKGANLSVNSSPLAAVYPLTTTSAATNTVIYAAKNASCGMFMPIGFDSYSAGKNVGGSVRVNSTAVKTTSNIFLTLCSNSASILAYPGATDGYFTIYFGPISVLGPVGSAIADGICISWLVVN